MTNIASVILPLKNIFVAKNFASKLKKFFLTKLFFREPLIQSSSVIPFWNPQNVSYNIGHLAKDGHVRLWQ